MNKDKTKLQLMALELIDKADIKKHPKDSFIEFMAKEGTTQPQPSKYFCDHYNKGGGSPTINCPPEWSDLTLEEAEEIAAPFETSLFYLETHDLREVDKKVSGLSPIDQITAHFEKIVPYSKSMGSDRYRAMFLNFNYTSTVQPYKKHLFNRPVDVNHIHGYLDNQDAIVFDYGDELDEAYLRMENLDDRGFLQNMKSFGYFHDQKYNDLMRFLAAESFDVHLMGHSCGLSDRLLLNTIFEHNNCRWIKIYYHKRVDGSKDYIERAHEISRHFTNKQVMRDKLVNIKDCEPLTL